MIRRTNFHPRHQQGVGLIEVLIAVLIMGIGLLGIAAMQATALRNSSSALERSQAVIQTYAILDAMRANRARALAGDYNLGKTCANPPPAAPGDSLAQSDLRMWRESLKTTLGQNGNSCGQIACDSSALCRIEVWWDDSRADNGADFGSATASSVVTRTTL